MTTVSEYFDKIFIINLDRRTDRWKDCLGEFSKFNITDYERVSGYAHPTNGNAGCTRSHRTLLRRIAESDWNRVLVLEDDFRILHDDFHQKFSDMIGLVPADWDMIYLGGHYASPPQKRINTHVIKMDRMFTTSSYGITRDFAAKLTEYIDDAARSSCNGPNPSPDDLLEVYLGPIDALYCSWLPSHNCYIFQPRLMVQRPGYSDLTEQVNNNEMCMTDTRHENMV